MDRDDIKNIRSFAKKNISEFLKPAKNILKATLSDNAYGVLFEFSKIGTNGSDVVAEDKEGKQILLRAMTKDKTAMDAIFGLPSKDYLKNQVLFGLAHYDSRLQQICVEPRSIITENEILRLAY